jgi:hypothetical protein
MHAKPYAFSVPDLWEDFAIWVLKKFGRIARLALYVLELAAGPDMASLGDANKTGATRENSDSWDIEPTEKEVATVKREVRRQLDLLHILTKPSALSSLSRIASSARCLPVWF